MKPPYLATCNAFLIWYSYLSIPASLVLLGVWAVAALIALIMHWRRRKIC